MRRNCCSSWVAVWGVSTFHATSAPATVPRRDTLLLHKFVPGRYLDMILTQHVLAVFFCSFSLGLTKRDANHSPIGCRGWIWPRAASRWSATCRTSMIWGIIPRWSRSRVVRVRDCCSSTCRFLWWTWATVRGCLLCLKAALSCRTWDTVQLGSATLACSTSIAIDPRCKKYSRSLLRQNKLLLWLHGCG